MVSAGGSTRASRVRSGSGLARAGSLSGRLLVRTGAHRAVERDVAPAGKRAGSAPNAARSSSARSTRHVVGGCHGIKARRTSGRAALPRFRTQPKPVASQATRRRRGRASRRPVRGPRGFRHGSQRTTQKLAVAPMSFRRPGSLCRTAGLTPGGSMKLLLTSSGISNTSIHNALVDLLGKPIAESNALCIPTAAYGTGSRGSVHGLPVHQRNSASAPCADWVGSRWECSSSPRCRASRKSIGSP